MIKLVAPITEEWTLSQIVTQRPPPGWVSVFQEAADELADVGEILDKKGSFLPRKVDLFRAFELTPLSHVSVVLIGQDPYHQILRSGPRARGMSFSVGRGDEIPSSLNNIFKELSNSIPNFRLPTHGDLTDWALQGVLLLNMSLTTDPGVPGAHGKIWWGFLSRVLTAINDQRPKTIFLLLGREAQKLKGMIGERGIVLETSHPSGLSAHRGFLGSNIFARTNKLLAKLGRPEINWNLS